MLLTLTPNPAIDRTLIVPGFRDAEVCRASERRDAAGGKGLNVTRVARALGLPVRACGPLGGDTGRQIAALAEAEGLEAHWHWLAGGESRICLLITDPQAQDTLTINEQGPQVSAADWTALAALVQQECMSASALAISGSLPLGVPVERFRVMLSEIAGQRPVLLDTSGAALAGTLDLPLALLKINAHELGDVLGTPLTTVEQTAAAAVEALSRGPRAVIVTMGRHGAVAANADGVWYARPPALTPVSPVGSGDAVMAGAAATLLGGGTLAEALCLGVACGAANALTVGAGVVRGNDLEQMLGATKISRV